MQLLLEREKGVQHETPHVDAIVRIFEGFEIERSSRGEGREFWRYCCRW